AITPVKTNEMITEGPALLEAAVPLNTNIPVPEEKRNSQLLGACTIFNLTNQS
ncbi:unnamed protein product, partial [Rotaria magnacalcarata]